MHSDIRLLDGCKLAINWKKDIKVTICCRFSSQFAVVSPHTTHTHTHTHTRTHTHTHTHRARLGLNEHEYI